MRRRAQRGVAVQAHGWPELEIGWEHTRGSEAVERSREAYSDGIESDGGRRRANGMNPDPCHPIYRGVH
jgi:hypothetical protein